MRSRALRYRLYRNAASGRVAMPITDALYDSVVALLHLDGSDGATLTQDVSKYSRAVGSNANAELDAAQRKFGVSSVLLSGNARDFVSCGDSAQFNMEAAGDWTIECFVRANSLASDTYTVAHFRVMSLDPKGVHIHINSSGQLNVDNGVAGSGLAAGSMTTGTWYHIAVTRQSGTTKLWVDGALVDSEASQNYGDADTRLQIGCYGLGATSGVHNWNGWIDEFRVTKGVARYTASFSPPVRAFGNRGPNTPPATEAHASALQAFTESAFAASHGTFTGGVEYWAAAPTYSWPFAADLYYAFHGHPGYFTSAQIAALAAEFVAAADGNGDLPIALTTASKVPLYWSSFDSAHNNVTGDGNLFLPLIYKVHYDKTADISTFNGVKDALKTAINRIPRDGTTKLVYVNPAASWIPWGFHDGVSMTGLHLMGSLIDYQASVALADMFTAAGDAADAATFTTRAIDIASSLDAALWDSGSGMYLGATVAGNRVDILGSAFALFLGIPSGAKKTSISQYLVNNFDSITKNGFVLQTPSGWSGGDGLTYDDGYWAVGTEWVATAIAYTNPTLAATFIARYLAGGDPTREWLGTYGSSTDGNRNNIASCAAAFRYASDNGL